jgi:uncharacterized delta-60 repeat protein
VRLASLAAGIATAGVAVGLAAGHQPDAALADESATPRFFADGPESALDVEALPGGRALALIRVYRGGWIATAVGRFLPSGRIDRRYGRNGIAVIRRRGAEVPGGLDVLGDGRVAISFGAAAPRRFARSEYGFARLRRNGRLDRAFAGDGIRIVSPEADHEEAYPEDVVVDVGGRITAVGRTFDSVDREYQFGLVRVDRVGRIDSTFSGDGRQATEFGHFAEAYAATLDSQGRLVVAGSGAGSIAVARYGGQGELDDSFAGDGTVEVDSGRDGRGVVPLADGGVAVAGRARGDFLAVRFSASGELDPEFSGDGYRRVDFRGGGAAASAVTARAGTLVLVGAAKERSGDDGFALALLTRKGRLDRDFSHDGRRVLGLSRRDDTALAVAVDSGARIVAAGTACDRCNRETSGFIRLEGRPW